MNTPNAQLLPEPRVMSEGGIAPRTEVPPAFRATLSRWYPFALLVATIAWAVVWHGDAVAQMVKIWWRSETFAHGLVIYPISIWLIYRTRAQLASVPIRPCPWALIAIGLVSFAALLGELSGVNAVREYAIVVMVPLIIWCVLGTALVRTILFPLAFTLLAVPVGEFMFPVLMGYTADFTVAALRLTGVPVYREGLLFTLPSGNWSVVEECSGLRYIIASITLGCLFAYLTYRSWWRRALFVLAAAVVPIVANWIRAYMIVMIGHLSGMRLAAGVDHLLYGWVFFGLVMLLLFWIGSFWREDLSPIEAPKYAQSTGLRLEENLGFSFVLAAVTAAVLSAAAPAFASYLNARSEFDVKGGLAIAPKAPWTEGVESALPDFVPNFTNARLTVRRTFSAEAPVGFFLGYYADQGEGRELISHGNEVTGSANKPWHRISETRRTVLDERYQLAETVVRSGQTELLVWHLYWIGGHWTIRKEEVKIRQAFEKLMGRGDASAVLVAYTSASSREEGRRRLEKFMAATLSEADRQLRALGGSLAPSR